jgi:hypothetical protein
MAITPRPNENKHIHQSKGLEYIPNKRKGSAMLETFLRGIVNQMKNKEKGKERGLESKKCQEKSNSIAKHTLYKGTHGGETIHCLAC